MSDATWKGALLSFVLCVIYFIALAVVAFRMDVPNEIGFVFLFCFWVPQLAYSLPILAVLRRKNLPRTRLGFKIVFFLLLPINIAFLVFMIRAWG
ncbi:MAG: hypothetical protein HQL80_10690 [Magnetococcales bacterium]|nr:hypothetical protein [Magnetococcales bacterium]